jgi:hypothetical protein
MRKLQFHRACLSQLLSRPSTFRLLWASTLALLLIASQAYAGQMRLVWDAVNGATLAGYRLYYGPSMHT